MNEFDILDAIGNIDDELISGAKRASRQKMLFGTATAFLLLFIAVPLLFILPRFMNSVPPATEPLPPPATVLPSDTLDETDDPDTFLPPPGTTIPEDTTPSPGDLPNTDYLPYPVYDWKNKPTDEELAEYTIDIGLDNSNINITNKTIKTGILIWFSNIVTSAPKTTISQSDFEASANKIHIKVSHSTMGSLEFTAIPGYLISYKDSDTIEESDVFSLHSDLYNELLLMLQCCDAPIEFSYTVNSVHNTPDSKVDDITIRARNVGAGFIYTGNEGQLWSEAKLFNDTASYYEKHRLYEELDTVNFLKTGTPRFAALATMAFKPLDEPVEVTEPTFEAFERQGFTVVEWGGTKLG